MKREVRVSDRVYTALYPRRLPTDPQSFTDHLNTHLVSEVRIETQRFYGGLETVEARYPGLNYTHPPHIKRLSYFPHHRRLFEVFRELGLTNGEILGLCRWEGTLWARQRYERDENIKVRDTTGEEIGPWTPREQRQRHARKVSAGTQTGENASPTSQRNAASQRAVSTGARAQSHLSIAQMLEQQLQRPQSATAVNSASGTQPDAIMHEAHQPESTTPIQADDSDSPTSPSAPLHTHDRSSRDAATHSRRSSLAAMTTDTLRRMRALAELRASGRDIDPSDPAFEQYLKEHAESGELPEGYEAAQTLANGMGTVIAMDAQSPPAAEVRGMDMQ